MGLLKDFRLQLESKFSDDHTSMPMSNWIVANTHLKKKPFSFQGYEFQRQIADDMHLNMSVIKCSQIGATEIQLRKFLGFLMRNTGLKGIFTLPNDIMFKRVSSTRVKPLIEGEDVFNKGAGEKPIRQVGIYQVGSSYGFFTGNKEGDATSIDADILFNDELDLSDKEIISLFNSRLQGSDIRMRQRFSTPTVIGYGIDGEFNSSDQHEYMVQCRYCRHHNIPKFTPEFINVPGLSSDLNDLSEIDEAMIEKVKIEIDEHNRRILVEAQILCERCHNPLDVHDHSLKHWVSKHPSKLSRGYAVRPLGTGRLDISYIVGELLGHKKKDTLRRWYNTVLGEAYNDSNSRLTEVQIRSVMRGEREPEIGASTPLFVGIDVGLTCHMIVIAMNGSKPAVVKWMQITADTLLDQLKLFMEHYNVVAGCIDRHPYTPLANELRDLTKNRILPLEYRGTAETRIVMDEFDNLSHVQANRTMMLDNVASSIRKMAIEFVGYGVYDHMVVSHLMDMVRIESEETPDTLNHPEAWNKPAVWHKLHGDDHWFHALAMGLQAMRMKAVIDSQEERDLREVVLVMPAHQKSPPSMNLGVQSLRKTTTSLGCR